MSKPFLRKIVALTPELKLFLEEMTYDSALVAREKKEQCKPLEREVAEVDRRIVEVAIDSRKTEVWRESFSRDSDLVGSITHRFIYPKGIPILEVVESPQRFNEGGGRKDKWKDRIADYENGIFSATNVTMWGNNPDASVVVYARYCDTLEAAQKRHRLTAERDALQKQMDTTMSQPMHIREVATKLGLKGWDYTAVAATRYLNYRELGFFSKNLFHLASPIEKFLRGSELPMNPALKTVLDSAQFDMSKFVELTSGLESLQQQVIGKPTVLIVGPTGGGKSTLANWFAGVQLQKRVDSKTGKDYITAINPVAKISASVVSETLRPNVVHLLDGTTLVDLPGFGDNRGDEIEAANAFLVNGIIRFSAAIQGILVILPFDNLDLSVERGGYCRRLFKDLMRMVPTQGYFDWSRVKLVINKSNENFLKRPWAEQLQFLKNRLDEIAKATPDPSLNVFIQTAITCLFTYAEQGFSTIEVVDPIKHAPFPLFPPGGMSPAYFQSSIPMDVMRDIQDNIDEIAGLFTTEFKKIMEAPSHIEHLHAQKKSLDSQISAQEKHISALSNSDRIASDKVAALTVVRDEAIAKELKELEKLTNKLIELTTDIFTAIGDKVQKETELQAKKSDKTSECFYSESFSYENNWGEASQRFYFKSSEDYETFKVEKRDCNSIVSTTKSSANSLEVVVTGEWGKDLKGTVHFFKPRNLLSTTVRELEQLQLDVSALTRKLGELNLEKPLQEKKITQKKRDIEAEKAKKEAFLKECREKEGELSKAKHLLLNLVQQRLECVDNIITLAFAYVRDQKLFTKPSPLFLLQDCIGRLPLAKSADIEAYLNVISTQASGSISPFELFHLANWVSTQAKDPAQADNLFALSVLLHPDQVTSLSNTYEFRMRLAEKILPYNRQLGLRLYIYAKQIQIENSSATY
jgi:predicted GTPase